MIKSKDSKGVVREGTASRDLTTTAEPLKFASEMEPVTVFSAETGATVQFGVSNATNESAGVDASPNGSPREPLGSFTSPGVSKMSRRVRQAEAAALFDPEALRFLKEFEHRLALSLDDVGAMAQTPVGWTKIAVLMQAYFVEVGGLHMRITEEGKSALSKLASYVQKVSADSGVEYQ